jgi:hypothetical protein
VSSTDGRSGMDLGKLADEAKKAAEAVEDPGAPGK